MSLLQAPPLQAQLEINDDPKLNEIQLSEYLQSIIYMPQSMKILCLTNLFCWMSLVCYSLYFTDFVGEAVFGGDPKVALSSLPSFHFHLNIQDD